MATMWEREFFGVTEKGWSAFVKNGKFMLEICRKAIPDWFGKLNLNLQVENAFFHVIENYCILVHLIHDEDQ